MDSGLATLMSQVAIVHDARPPACKAFGSAGLHDASEDDFCVDVGHLLDRAALRAAGHRAQGLTPAQLRARAAENARHPAALKAQRRAVSGRSAATQTRQLAPNALYNELSALCAVGQGLFKQTDGSKYNDYVVAPAVHSAAPAVLPAK